MSERKERGMLFSGEMVKALLAGTKTQTRRAIREQPINPKPTCDEGVWSDTKDPVTRLFGCPYGEVGDVLYAKETFGINPDDGGYVYRATDPDWETGEGWKWKPSIFMPRAASRIDLEIVAIRVERLQDISEADAKAEGAPWICVPLRSEGLVPPSIHGHGHKMGYFILWESIHGQGSWAVNPWLWCITFKRIKP